MQHDWFNDFIGKAAHLSYCFSDVGELQLMLIFICLMHSYTSTTHSEMYPDLHLDWLCKGKNLKF